MIGGSKGKINPLSKVTRAEMAVMLYRATHLTVQSLSLIHIYVYKRQVGDMVEFGGLLGSAPIMPIKTGSPAKFINRGGRIPAPIQSLKN